MAIENNELDTVKLEEELVEFWKLSNEEYGKNPIEILNDQSITEEEQLKKIARLMGVIIKEPFSDPISIDPSQSDWGAFRRWELNKDLLKDKSSEWQYSVMDVIRKEEDMDSVSNLAIAAHYEMGFFYYLSRSCRRFICGNPTIKKEISKSEEQIQKAISTDNLITPKKLLSFSGATSIAGYLIQAIPWLTTASIPLLAPLILIIGKIGIDAFCDWSTSPPEIRQE
jgi:hypothetical protein